VGSKVGAAVGEPVGAAVGSCHHKGTALGHTSEPLSRKALLKDKPRPGILQEPAEALSRKGLLDDKPRLGHPPSLPHQRQGQPAPRCQDEGSSSA
jgi:hypothetical protein